MTSARVGKRSPINTRNNRHDDPRGTAAPRAHAGSPQSAKCTRADGDFCQSFGGLGTKERKRGVNYNDQQKIIGTVPKKDDENGSVRCSAARDHVRLRGLCEC